MVVWSGVFFEKSNKIMKSIQFLELKMIGVGLFACGILAGVLYFGTCDEPTVFGASMPKIEKKQRAEKPAVVEEGFDVKGRVKVSIENE
jgi:hypothetical protein